MGSQLYPANGQAGYTVRSNLAYQKFSLKVSGDLGSPETLSHTTDASGEATGSFTVPPVDQLWSVGVTFGPASGSARCSASFQSSGR